jgi:hypothetical protein
VNPAVPVVVTPTTPQPNVVAPPPNPTAQNPAAKPAPGDEPKEEKHHKGNKPGHEPKGAVPTAATPTAPVAPTQPAAPKPGKKKGGDELDDLLNGAAPDKAAPAAKHSAPKEEPAGGGDNLPDQLGKSDIVSGMQKIKGKVGDCYAQFKVPGMANVAVTIGKNGHVSAATVSGSFAGTPTGSCVERAVKSAGFPPVKGSPTSINYPFMLR